jgi:16S rRNA (cytosine1402-N4)-methyltransferase
MSYRHVPVMTKEVIALLKCRPGKTYVDCTVGGGGHSQAILDNIAPNGLLIAIDQDPDAIRYAKARLCHETNTIHLLHDNFVNLPQILFRFGLVGADGILLDLGMSLYQIESSRRGFSFQKDEPLDMRMNPEAGETAQELIHRLSEKELRQLLTSCGEERHAGKIARAIVRSRKRRPIATTQDLTRIVIAVAGTGPAGSRRIHPATRVFMALRIAVNRELERLERFMDDVADMLNPGGRLCVLAFHSLEDRIVKQRLRQLAKGCICPPDFPVCACGRVPQMQIITRRVLRPSETEINRNPQARSTRLRAAEKL